MTVQELINLLQTVDDKSLQIMYEDNEFGMHDITEVFKHDPHAWDNPIDPLRNFYTFQ